MKNQIERFQEWFKSEIPEPNIKEQAMQLGKHFSKVTDALMVLGIPYIEIQYTADDLKTGQYDLFLEARSQDEAIREELTKSLAHQIVTALGVAHMYNLNVVDILNDLDEDTLTELTFKDQSTDEEDNNDSEPDGDS